METSPRRDREIGEDAPPNVDRGLLIAREASRGVAARRDDAFAGESRIGLFLR
jgi:hypothetical protein